MSTKLGMMRQIYETHHQRDYTSFVPFFDWRRTFTTTGTLQNAREIVPTLICFMSPHKQLSCGMDWIGLDWIEQY